MHGFGDEVFAEDGAEGGASVAAVGVGGGASAFELDVVVGAVEGGDFAKEDRSSVAEVGIEGGELVAGVGHGEGGGAGGEMVAGESGEAVGGVEEVGGEAELVGEIVVECDEFGGGDGGGFGGLVEGVGEVGVGVLEGEHGKSEW